MHEFVRFFVLGEKMGYDGGVINKCIVKFNENNHVLCWIFFFTCMLCEVV